MTNRFIEAKQAARLRSLVRRYRGHPQRSEKSWPEMNDDDLWLRVLTEIAVAGRAAAGDTLEKSVEARRQVRVSRLRAFQTDLELQRHLHWVLWAAGTRYVSETGWRTNKKAQAAVHNFRALMEAGGPKRFFEQVARMPEQERVTFLRNRLQYSGPKGSRDMLIGLGLAKNCVALDSRIQGLLAKLGANATRRIGREYEKIEQDLIRNVARPLKLSGAELDRILFQNYNALLADIRLTAGAQRSAAIVATSAASTA